MPHFLMVYMLTCIAPSVDAPALRNECDEQKHASGSSARISGPIRRVIASDIMADTLDGSSPNNSVVMYGLASMMSRKARDLGCASELPIGVSSVIGRSLDAPRLLTRVTVVRMALPDLDMSRGPSMPAMVSARNPMMNIRRKMAYQPLSCPVATSPLSKITPTIAAGTGLRICPAGVPSDASLCMSSNAFRRAAMSLPAHSSGNGGLWFRYTALNAEKYPDRLVTGLPRYLRRSMNEAKEYASSKEKWNGSHGGDCDMQYRSSMRNLLLYCDNVFVLGCAFACNCRIPGISG